jgi:hypothetical protein
MGPTLVGYLIQGSLKYGWYEVFKPITAAFLASEGISNEGSGKLLSFMMAGAVAEFIGSTFLCPFEAARIRMVANPTFADGVLGCMMKMVNEETAESLFRGLPAILAKQIPYTVVQLSTYEFITSSVYSYLSGAGWDSSDVAPYRFGISTAAALVAAVLSSLASQPGDTLLSAVNKSARSRASRDNSNTSPPPAAQSVPPVYMKENSSSSPSRSSVSAKGKSIAAAAAARSDGSAASEVVAVATTTQAQGTFELMVETVNELGLKGLFKGTKARLFHMITIVVSQLLVYDFVKQLCGIPVTGSH